MQEIQEVKIQNTLFFPLEFEKHQKCLEKASSYTARHLKLKQKPGEGYACVANQGDAFFPLLNESCLNMAIPAIKPAVQILKQEQEAPGASF